MNYHAKEIKELDGWKTATGRPRSRRRKQPHIRAWLLSAAVGVLFAGCMFPWVEQENRSDALSANATGQVVVISDYAEPFPEMKMEASAVTGTAEIHAETVEDFENEKIEAALLAKATKLEDVKITFYCCEKRKHICGTGDGLTASGTEVTPYVSVAVDPKVIPLGSTVLVDFGDGVIHYFVAEDTGGAVKGNHIDIAVVSHEEALKLGVKSATVYWIGGEDDA